MTMTTSDRPRVADPLATERENTRVVYLIELAEREHPFCSCGAANGASVHDDTVWLECSTLREPRAGVRGFLDRIGAFHTRHRITELSASFIQH